MSCDPYYEELVKELAKLDEKIKKVEIKKRKNITKLDELRLEYTTLLQEIIDYSNN